MTWKRTKLSDLDWKIEEPSGRFVIWPSYDSHGMPYATGCVLRDTQRIGVYVGSNFKSIKAAKEEAEKRSKE